MGDGLMALFSSPDEAAGAAERMHIAMQALPAVEGHKLGVRIGFHAGPVIQRDNDVFGDTVNLAARLVEQATRGQALTSAHTASLLAPGLRSATRRLYDITVRGKIDDIGLCEFLWQKSPDITNLPVARSAGRTRRVHLRVRYAGKELVFKRQVEAITMGRDPDCAFVVDDPNASRRHCVLERRQGKFVVRDHSSNGTYVAVEGEQGETLLRREEMTLRGHGWITFGLPKERAEDVVEYWCE
jgi:adenylate cyclase